MAATAAPDLATAVSEADIVSCATLATAPLVVVAGEITAEGTLHGIAACG